MLHPTNLRFVGAFISVGDCDPPLRRAGCSFYSTAYRSGGFPPEIKKAPEREDKKAPEREDKKPLKREDARHFRTWHSYEKVIRKPAALATVSSAASAVFLRCSAYEQSIGRKNGHRMRIN